MTGRLASVLADEEIAELVDRAVDAADAGDDERAWHELKPLLRGQARQREAAVALTSVVERCCLPRERGLEALDAVAAAHTDDEALLALVGEALQGARDIDDLNSAPPVHPLFGATVAKLAAAAVAARGTDAERHLLHGLGTAARMMGRQHDELAGESYRRLTELEPQRSSSYYNYGLFLKTRGRFREGVEQNRRAIELAQGEPSDGYEWNLGICATGANEGAVALDVWKRLGQKIEMGRFGLPEGRYPTCKVKLAERPLAERTAATDDAGREETIWIERLSPCHGVVRSVLFQRLGVDYGDVVLFDGAPMTHHRYGEDLVPVFPHLATLIRSGYRFFDFAGTQDEPRRLAGVSSDLAGDAIVYSHTESYRTICSACWRDGNVDHEHGEAEERHVVKGRIAAPPRIEPADLLQQLDIALAARSPCKLFAPSLCEAAGFERRAEVERRRYDLLASTV